MGGGDGWAAPHALGGDVRDCREGVPFGRFVRFLHIPTKATQASVAVVAPNGNGDPPPFGTFVALFAFFALQPVHGANEEGGGQ